MAITTTEAVPYPAASAATNGTNEANAAGSGPIISERARAYLPAIARGYTLTDCAEELRRIATATPTGFDVLESVGMRWVPGTVTGVIARPGAGKTQFLLESCLRYLDETKAAGTRAVFLSWEESPAALVVRLVQRIDARTTKSGNGFAGETLPNEAVRAFIRKETVHEEYRDRIAQALQEAEPLLERLRIIGGASIGTDIGTVFEALAALMREADAPRVGFVAVDYFQHLETGSVLGERRLDELRRVANTLLRFALGSRFFEGKPLPLEDADHPFAVPVVIGAQVNRNVKQSSTENAGHPTGDDIREADDLLNVANAIIALSWVADTSAITSEKDPQRFLRVSVPKHRSGMTRGTFGDEVARVAWRPARAWISERTERGFGDVVEWSEPQNPKENSSTGSKSSTAASSSAGGGIMSESLPGVTKHNKRARSLTSTKTRDD